MTIRYRYTADPPWSEGGPEVHQDDNLRHHLAAVHNYDATDVPDLDLGKVHGREHVYPHTSAGAPTSTSDTKP